MGRSQAVRHPPCKVGVELRVHLKFSQDFGYSVCLPVTTISNTWVSRGGSKKNNNISLLTNYSLVTERGGACPVSRLRKSFRFIPNTLI
jgi:hypothetical protein